MTNHAKNGDAVAAAGKLVRKTLDERVEVAVIDVDDSEWPILRAAYKAIAGDPRNAVEQRILDVVNIRCGVPRLGMALRPPKPEQARALAEAAAAVAALEIISCTKRDALFVIHDRTRANRGREASRDALAVAQTEYDAAEAAATAARARLHEIERRVKDQQVLDWCRPAL